MKREQLKKVFLGCVYIWITVVIAALPFSGSLAAPVDADRFQWKEHGRLKWDDFKGDSGAIQDESAAATYCSIGFRTRLADDGGLPLVEVYNTFYVNRSWVKPNARLQSVLDHEQGHFDLCEVYTRRLRQRMAAAALATGTQQPDRQLMIALYSEVSAEYEQQQQLYEEETLHGTIAALQVKWQLWIMEQLQATEALS
jgi:hypothetical protein